MAIKNSTIQKHHYFIVRMMNELNNSRWTVYQDGLSIAVFKTHELALMYTIERTNVEHWDDWLLTYALVDSRWIMFLINERRKMFCVIDNQHANQMELDSRKAYRWMCRLKISHRFRRELTGIVIFNETLNNKLKQAARGEWIKYGATEESDSSE